MIADQVRAIVDGGRTRRFHTVRTITTQDVAAHSYGVAMLVRVLLGPNVRAAVLLDALQHDMAEVYMGDIPAPTKRKLGISESVAYHEAMELTALGFVTEELTTEERRAVKFADCFDGMLFCVTERSMGNRAVGGTYNNYRSYVAELGPTGTAYEVYSEIARQWETANV